MSPLRRTAAALLLLAVSAAGAGCTESNSAGAESGTPRVLASFYPLQWVTEQVAGSPVTSLTQPGAEPHDVELPPRSVADIAEADLVVYLKGFQPAVDGAVEGRPSGAGYDVSPAADLMPASGEPETANEPASDPHFWLDPLRLAAVADGIADRLGDLDPDTAERYRSNATTLRATLVALDRDYAAGLATCASKQLVTSHDAFGYLARRYGLTQISISGPSPEGEPKPGDLARVADAVRRAGVRTIYYETLVSPKVARTVAAETGATAALLDPIEGLTDASRGRNYVQIMRSNLATLREGQRCR